MTTRSGTTTLPNPRESGSERRRVRSAILPVLVSAALVIPNLVVIALGVEDFPFTTAPMFAQYVGPETELYAFRFEGVRDGAKEPLPLDQTNVDPREVQRQLVSWFYRPMVGTSPFRDLSGASSDRAGLEARMTEFFKPIVDFLDGERSLSFDRVDLYVDTVDSVGNVARTELVGSYDPSSHEYTPSYGVEG